MRGRVQRATRRTGRGRVEERQGRARGSDLEAIKAATEKPFAVGVQELGKRLYEQAAAAGASSPTDGAGAGPSQGDDEVVDAEIVDEGHGS